MRPGMRELVSRLRNEVSNSEVCLWPTCLHCIEESYVRHPRLGHSWVPVDSYRIEPDFWNQVPLMGGGSVVEAKWFYPPRERASKGWFKVIVTCHGKEAEAEVDVPEWWGTAHVLAAIQSMMFFGQDKKPDHGMITRIK